ncbi:condensation domain-containing protein [Metabacillus idriensis]|uniref:condensation domain-containing protein n=1 Tax=Metabacillus idriensis TaxID=324768 RepID=UPI00174E223B|nr:condensation domain-containing protein [Metabacillus idriensis]
MNDKFVEHILKLVSKGEISEKNAFTLIKQYQSTSKSSLTLNSEKNEKNHKDIAIIGVACRFPQANNKDEYWTNLVNGYDAIREFPESRMKRVRQYLSKKREGTYISAGYLNDVETFDAEFFNILPGEAKYMDPQQRIFMETGYEAIEDAGYGGERIKGSRVGIYTGFSEARYRELIEDNSPAAFVGNFPPIIASRLSYALNLSGPALSVATACSSSLVALHLACKGIFSGDCEMALVGGVAIGSLPGELEEGNLGISSLDGKSRSFDAKANGTGWGEGCGAVLIKPLKQAIKDNDCIYSIIKGSAVNQDGTSNGIASPNALAQEEVLLAAWKDAGVDPKSISYIEAHGTGTKIGDPIEVKGITNAFRKHTNNKQFCGLGSVKSNIGHLDSASGMAGLIKTILALKNKQIPPTLHFTNPNPLMNLYQSPVYINTELAKWKRSGDLPLRAGVSSFGLSGTNCHVVLEEYRDNQLIDSVSTSTQGRVFTISAKTKNALHRLISKYIEFLKGNNKYQIDDICYVLNTGREHFRHRLAIPVYNLDELLKKLQLTYDFFNNQNGARLEEQGIFSSLFNVDGEVPGELDRSHYHGHTSLKSLVKLAQNYVEGQKISWSAQYQTGTFVKIPLPTYSWEKKHFWIEPSAQRTNTLLLKDRQESNDNANNFSSSMDNLNDTELRIGYIWSNVLGLEEIDVYADFFQLGGDSLLATDLITRIEKEFNAKITLTEFFEKPSIRELSVLLGEMKNIQRGEIISVEAKDFYPVSNAQRRQFILNQMSKDNLSYNMPGSATISGKIDLKRFERVFNMLVERHESFRTVFDIVNGEIVQTVLPMKKFEIEYCGTGISNINDSFKKFIRPFKLDEGPLLRVRLEKIIEDPISDNKHLFMFDMHHIISDGVSMEVLLKEFAALYAGEQLTPLIIQYKDFANWQNQLLNSEVMQNQEVFWREVLRQEKETDLQVLDIPADYPRPPKMTFEGGVHSLSIEKEIVHQLKAIGQKQGATLYMTLLAIYNIFLHKYTGKEDIIVGSLVAGRRNSGTANTIGLFTNYLPMRNFPDGRKKFIDFLNEVSQRTVKAFDNQEFPFEKMVEIFDKKRDISRNPIFDSMIILHNQGFQNNQMQIQNLNLEMIDWESESSTMDLKFDIFQRPNGELNLKIEYYSQLFKKQTIIKMANHFVSLIKLIVSEPNKKIDEYNFFTPKDVEELEKRKKITQSYSVLSKSITALNENLYPLSAFQNYIWNNRDRVNNCIIQAKVQGKIEQVKLIKALKEMQSLDSSLRTNFEKKSSFLYQKIHEQLPIDYVFLALKDMNMGIELSEIIASEYSNPFNIYQGSLYRVRLVYIGGDIYHLIITIDPLISELLEMNNFLSHLFNIYSLLTTGEVVNYKSYKTLSIPESAVRQDKMVKEETFEYRNDYWNKTLLKPYPQVNFPIKQTTETNSNQINSSYHFSLKDEEVRYLLKFAENNNSSLVEVIMACYFLLLKQVTNSKEIIVSIIDLPIKENSKQLVPLSVNYPIPLRISMEDMTSFNHLLNAVKNSFRELSQMSMYPFNHLFNQSILEDDELHSSIYSVLFAEEDWTSNLPELDILDIHHYRAKNSLLKLSLVRENSGRGCVFSWDSNLLETTYVNSLIERFKKIIQTVVKSASNYKEEL